MAIAVLGGACVFGLAALYTDWRQREIPHWLGLGLGLLWAVAAWLAPEALDAAPLIALACGAGALAVGFALHALGWLGGGDGKLLAALAVWIGPVDLVWWLVATALLGLLLLLFALMRRSGDLRTRGIPFAWAMAPPAIVILLERAVALSGG